MKTTAPLILASGSPRRKELLTQVGIPFEVVIRDFDERMPSGLTAQDLARYLAESKSNQCRDLTDTHAVLTADTIVCTEDRVLNKPANREEALQMLRTLSGKEHWVVTGICLRYQYQTRSRAVTTVVRFGHISEAQMAYYVDKYKPYDKAGAYGIQEWIGMVAIEEIEGDYYNVVGLPVRAVLELMEGMRLIKWEE